MASTSETGHAKNVANFETLIQYCTGYGSSYNPSKASIQLASLNTKYTQAFNALNEVNEAVPANTLAVNERDIVFKPLSKLVTRIMNAVEASDVTKLFIDDVKTLVRKLQGKRAAKIQNPVPPEGGTNGDEPPKTHSVSQMSFDGKIENFDKLILLLAAEPNYNPNEEELKVTTLQTLLAAMRNSNLAVIETEVPLSNARISRNNVLYNSENGLPVLAQDVKKYVKSVFGADSPQFKQISKIKINNYKS